MTLVERLEHVLGALVVIGLIFVFIVTPAIKFTYSLLSPLISPFILEFKAQNILNGSVEEPDKLTIKRTVATNVAESIVCISATHEAGLTGKHTTGIYAVAVPTEHVYSVPDAWAYSIFCQEKPTQAPPK